MTSYSDIMAIYSNISTNHCAVKNCCQIDYKWLTPREKMTQKSRDSLRKPSGVSVGGVLIWKHGVLSNIKIYLIRQQIYQTRAPTKHGVSRLASQYTPRQGLGHDIIE